jgi:hypothetical protein
MNEQRVIEALETYGGSWRDYILVGDPPAISRFTPPVRLMGLVVEDNALYRECVEFLRSPGARCSASADDVKRASGWDGQPQ